MLTPKVETVAGNSPGMTAAALALELEKRAVRLAAAPMLFFCTVWS